MTTYVSGRQAEAVAAQYLKDQGFKVLGQNWRTRWCEIDIVAQKAKTIYFVEVKYRKSDAFGGGLDYITPKKLKQMEFAAEMWVSQNRWTGDYQMLAIAIDGNQIELIEIA